MKTNNVSWMLLVVGALLSSASAPAQAQVPSLLNFSGRLGTEAGDFTGVADVTVTLYDDATSMEVGHVLWADTQDVFVDAGRFHLLLGADPGNPLPDGLLTVAELYVGVAVNGEAEMTPRMRVASVPFALYAGDSALLAGKGPEAFATAGHAHGFSGITGTVSATQLPPEVTFDAELAAGLAGKSDMGHDHAGVYSAAGHDHDATYVNEGQAGSVTTGMVLDRTLLPVDLADWGCATGQVAKWTAGTPGGWGCGDDVDTDTKYLPGTGLTLAGTTFNVDEVVVRGWCYDAPTELYSLLDTRYAATAHNHDTLYYKKSEIDTMLQQAVAQFLLLLDTKADKVHAHVIADVTGLQTSLDGKAAKAHAHATTDVTGLQTAVEGWAKGVCYDTAADLATAVPGWDQNASDDLTVGTTFAGDVTGLYNNLQIASGAVGSQEIADATKYVSVQNSTSADQFAVTDGSPVLQFAGGGATTVSFDAATHRVTISSASDVDGVIGNEVTNATDGSLTRSGAGTPASPYTLAINPGFNNVWTQAQTFQIGAKFPGGGTWDPTGNLGIGTAPSYPLEVRKSADNIYAASINNTSAIGFGLEVRTSSASASQAVVEVYNGLTANLFRIGADGSVGIGTTGPTARLDVAGPIQSRAGTTSTGELRMTTTGGTQYAGFKAPTSLLSPVMLTMPTSYPLATGQVLGSDGAGNLSWVTPGTVTSVGLAMPSQFTVTNSPVTASGTLTASWVAQSPNQVLAGPATGTGTGIPAFRALVAADIPTLSTSVLGSGILPIARGGTNSTATPTLGGVVYGNGAGYSVSGAGSSTQVLKGGASNPTWGSVALATDVSGTLPAANGGTGFSTYSVGNLLVADTTSSLAKLAPVASGNVLRSEGVGVVPSWGKVNLQNHTAGVLLPGNGGTGIAVVGPAGSVAYSDGSYFAFNAQGLNGQYLKSAGTGTPVWGGIAAGDVPSGSTHYIQNQSSSAQSASMFIDGSVTAGGFSFSPAKSYTVSIHSGSFLPQTSANGYGGGGLARYPISGGYQFLDAPLSLPQGATIGEITCWVMDNCASSSIWMSLQRQSHGSMGGAIGCSGQGADTSTWASSTTVKPITIANCGEVVDNTVRTIRLELGMDSACGSNTSLATCRLAYAVTAL